MNTYKYLLSNSVNYVNNLLYLRAKLYFALIMLTSAFAFNTYLTANFFGFGDTAAEGLAVLCGLTFIIFNIRKSININFTLIVYTVYFLYLILITNYYILIENHNFLKLIFAYQYIPFIILLANVKNIKHNFLIDSICQKSYLIICLFASISAIVGLLQFFNLIDLIPSDGVRARGLSRSTLNYSSLLFLAFICANQIKNNILKILFILIIFPGLLASMGKSGIFAAILYYCIKYIKSWKNIFCIIFFFTVSIVFLDFLDFNFFEMYPKLSILNTRLINGFDVENDIGNSLRINSYLNILNEFKIHGFGIGSTGPAAERFQSGTGYESFTLALIAQGGVIGILSFILIGFTQVINNKHLDFNILALIIAYFFIMSVHQTFETPCVNILAWIILFLHVSQFRVKKSDV